MGGMGTSPPSPSALFGPLWSWLSWCSGNPTEGLVGRGPCQDSLSTGLLPLCWPEGPCSQKPGQTPQVRCAAAVPAAERRGVRKRRKGCPLGAQHGPTALFTGGPHSPVPGCHRAQHHPEDVSLSLPLPRGCCFSRRPGQRLHRECFSPKLGHCNDLLPPG